MAKRNRRRSTGAKRKVAGILLFVLSLLLLVSLITHSEMDDARLRGEMDGQLNPFETSYRNQAGLTGAFLSWCLDFFFGWLAFFVPAGFIILSLKLFSSELTSKLGLNSLLLLVLSMAGSMLYNISGIAVRTVGHETGAIGGYVAEKLTRFSIALFGETGSYLVLIGLTVILLIAFTSLASLLSVRIRIPSMSGIQTVFSTIGERIRWGYRNIVGALHRAPVEDSGEGWQDDGSDLPSPTKLPDRTEDSTEPDETEGSDLPTERRKSVMKKKAEPVQVESVDYNYPTLDLLTDSPHSQTAVTSDELELTARMLKETLETFDVNIDGRIESFPGPVITRYEFKPAAGIKVNRIVGLSDDLALALKARRIRIIAPIPGKAAVGVEIPNRSPQTVYMKEILESEAYNDPKRILPLALGLTTSGKPYVADLASMPHLLIAGATGSGKSVCMNALITSLIYRLHPHQVRFIFIDPKMLELSVYSGIPHLGRPVITKPNRAEKVFADTVAEMESRYRRLANAGVRNIEGYNSRQSGPEGRLPYIIIFVDELADLMMSSTSSKTELLITRLAQMARAVGIHLILATQRPSVDVITGLIKANFPARIAFQVSSKVDSRTILDGNGAEKLLGNGDMLFLSAGQPEPIRVHGAYVSSDETDAIVSFVSDQGLSMMALEGISQATGETTESEIDLGDPLFREACEVVVRHKQGSVSLLQRRLGIGYQRAARLIDKLEQAGVVSTFDGSKARDVLVDQAYIDAILSGKSAPSSSEQ